MILNVESLRKRLGARRVIDDISLSCEAGEITVLTGDNGTGKSTLLALITGVMKADAGTVLITPESDSGQRQTQHPVSYVPEAANPPGYLTGAELFELVRQLKSAPPLAAEVHQALGLAAIEHSRIERLSLGERRRVCLATALIGDPALLVLDEPTNGLDVSGVATLVTLLLACRERGAAMLIATHDREFADQVADIRLHLADGVLRTVDAEHETALVSDESDTESSD